MFACQHKRPNASARLICFPWAGGDTAFYSSWGKTITSDIEVSVLCQAGRDERLKEPLCYDGKKTLEEVVAAIKDKYLDKPFAFCGHSAGAILAFSVAVELKKRYNKEPALFIVSGAQPPQSQSYTDLLKNTDDDFVARITDSSLGGMSSELVNSAYMQEVFIPLFKADVSVMRGVGYKHAPGDAPPLSCPFGVFVGEGDDPELIKALPEWANLTTGSCAQRKGEGSHFFLTTPKGSKAMQLFIEMSMEDEM